ncbi:DEAD/DEAH box helicase [Gordonia sp. ABSL11-1]|uniref:DEAD/DEAH box helicase n=1 Tax=Gordonia sp. ABSL11-1 TaxID=3053924 RepID=UPI002573A1F7|nr:DEAD/DEAH box helicase [Gordonia sp. ABSL11-1]MDL9947124.1 DEAD/DEAH box helicase [Gordonia sp. ABSL11-1]
MSTYDPLGDSASDFFMEFDEGTLDRGSDYADDGRVFDMKWSDDQLVLRGLCEGSGQNTYEMHAVFTADGTKRTLTHTECSCPVGMMCKHGVALLLTALDNETWGERPHTRGAQVATLPAQWRTALGAFVRAQPDEDAPVAPIGIQVEIPAATSYDPQPGPVLRLVTLGARRTWVRTGISWGSVAEQHSRLWRSTSFDASAFDPEHLRAVRAVVRAARDTGTPGDRSVISLSSGPPDIWELIEQACDAGVTLHPHHTTDATSVELFRSSRISFHVSRGAGGVLVTPEMQVDHDAWHGSRVGLIGFGTPHGAFTVTEDGVLLMGPFESPPDRGALESLVTAGGIVVPDDEIEEFTTELLPALAATVPVAVDDDALPNPTIEGPLPLLVIRVGAESSTVDWEIRYLVNGRPRDFTLDDRVAENTIRDASAETQAWKSARPAMELVAQRCTRWQQQAGRIITQARHAGLRADDRDLDAVVAADITDAVRSATTGLLRRTFTYSLLDTAILLGELVPELGDDILVEVIGEPADFRPTENEPEIVIGEDESPVGNDWLNLRIGVEVDGHRVPLGDVIRGIASRATHLLLPDGTYFSLTTPELQRLADLLREAQALGEVENGLIRRNTYNATLWDELLGLGTVDEQLAQWHSRVRQLATASVPPPAGPPVGLHADLRDYQAAGLDWLRFLWQNRIGGILADDMGLGKTVQALALIAEASAEVPTGCFLVVAPTSVVANWVSEANRFVPELEAVSVTTTEAKSGIPFGEKVGGAQIVVTSYTLLRLQFEAINEIRWTGVIFDEAQFVKNHHSKTHQCARRLGAEIKIAITGTPMENNLMELWSLLSLTAPGLYPSPKVFGDYYRKPIESGQHPERLAELRRRIRPVMLRRTKDQVVSDLPVKQEQVLAIELGVKHERIYQTHLNRERQKVLGLLGDWEDNRFAIFTSLTKLRQLSLHAGLIDDDHLAVASAKIDYLAEQLPELIAEGHAALVFSQFTGFLGLVRERLVELGIAHSYLDGSMSASQRKNAIDEFTSGTSKVFLISLKAGGFGLNLTEADYCFVCDPWWNPAAEAQAVDRTHRIGQTRPVTVYRLVSKGTIEENVVALQAKKRALFDAVVDDGDLFGAGLTPDDVRAMIGDL